MAQDSSDKHECSAKLNALIYYHMAGYRRVIYSRHDRSLASNIYVFDSRRLPPLHHASWEADDAGGIRHECAEPADINE